MNEMISSNMIDLTSWWKFANFSKSKSCPKTHRIKNVYKVANNFIALLKKKKIENGPCMILYKALEMFTFL